VPVSAAIFLAGFFAITGSPPFGPFVSEVLILGAAFAAGRWLVGGLFLVFLFLVFAGMGGTSLAALQGRPSPGARSSPYRDSFTTAAPAIVLLAAVLVLGLYLPGPLRALLEAAAAALGAGR